MKKTIIYIGILYSCFVIPRAVLLVVDYTLLNFCIPNFFTVFLNAINSISLYLYWDTPILLIGLMFIPIDDAILTKQIYLHTIITNLIGIILIPIATEILNYWLIPYSCNKIATGVDFKRPGIDVTSIVRIIYAIIVFMIVWLAIKPILRKIKWQYKKQFIVFIITTISIICLCAHLQATQGYKILHPCDYVDKYKIETGNSNE